MRINWNIPRVSYVRSWENTVPTSWFTWDRSDTKFPNFLKRFASGWLPFKSTFCTSKYYQVLVQSETAPKDLPYFSSLLLLPFSSARRTWRWPEVRERWKMWLICRSAWSGFARRWFGLIGLRRGVLRMWGSPWWSRGSWGRAPVAGACRASSFYDYLCSFVKDYIKYNPVLSQSHI